MLLDAVSIESFLRRALQKSPVSLPLLERLFSLSDRWHARPSRAPVAAPPVLERIKEFLFAIVHDSMLAPQSALAFGLRGAAPSFRQLVFKHDSLAIDLRIPAPTDQPTDIRGQVFGAPTENARVSILVDGEMFAHAELTRGEFTVPSSGIQKFQLVFDFPDRATRWLTPQIEVEGAAPQI